MKITISFPRWGMFISLALLMLSAGALFIRERIHRASADEQPTAAAFAGKNTVSRSLQDFLGLDLASSFDGKTCVRERIFHDDLTFVTQTCKLKENESHQVYATFLLDERFPQLKGRLLSVRAVLSRSVWNQRAALDGYLASFAQKYGVLRDAEGRTPLDDANGEYAVFDSILICPRGKSQCDVGAIAFHGQKSFNNTMFQLDFTGLKGTVFTVIELGDVTAYTMVSDQLNAEAKRKAAGAVE